MLTVNRRQYVLTFSCIAPETGHRRSPSLHPVLRVLVFLRARRYAPWYKLQKKGSEFCACISEYHEHSRSVREAHTHLSPTRLNSFRACARTSPLTYS